MELLNAFIILNALLFRHGSSARLHPQVFVRIYLCLPWQAQSPFEK